MKTVSLVAVLAIAVGLLGCEDPELVTCQQEKDVLQSQLDLANTTIEKKEGDIEVLKTENTEMQTKAMEGIQVMMTKQAENDNKLKQKIVEKDQMIQTQKEKNLSLEVENAALKTKVEAYARVLPEVSGDADTVHGGDDDDDDN